jgi:hypothetical protein
LPLALFLAMAIQILRASRTRQCPVTFLAALLAAHSLCLLRAHRRAKPPAAFGAAPPSWLAVFHGVAGIPPDRHLRQLDPRSPSG